MPVVITHRNGHRAVGHLCCEDCGALSHSYGSRAADPKRDICEQAVKSEPDQWVYNTGLGVALTGRRAVCTCCWSWPKDDPQHPTGWVREVPGE